MKESWVQKRKEAQTLLRLHKRSMLVTILFVGIYEVFFILVARFQEILRSWEIKPEKAFSQPPSHPSRGSRFYFGVLSRLFFSIESVIANLKTGDRHWGQAGPKENSVVKEKTDRVDYFFLFLAEFTFPRIYFWYCVGDAALVCLVCRRKRKTKKRREISETRQKKNTNEMSVSDKTSTNAGKKGAID